MFIARWWLYLVVWSLLCTAAARAQTSASPPEAIQFVNGQWFDGKGFKPQVFYSVRGVLTRRRPTSVNQVVDLKAGYVIPPFADAHTHNLDGVNGLDAVVEAYLDEGTFYVQVLTNTTTGAKEAKPLVNKPTTVDVQYANGALTCTYGHPFMVYEPFALGIYDGAEAYRRVAEVKKSRRAENNAYWFLDSRSDVDQKMPRLLAMQPDVIKIMLLDAENYDRDLAAGNRIDRGLSPDVAGYVVRKAHQAGLRVYAHIETANDFRLCLKIGVDGVAHAPYYGWNGSPATAPKDDLTDADLRLAARKKMVVIPTALRGVLFGATDYDADGKGTLDPFRSRQVIARQKALFQRMHKAGVTLAFGLDVYGKTVAPEIWHFHDNNIFDNRTLLKIAAETTPQSLYPKRKIGKLKEGYEASFLLLGGNPLEDFSQIRNITLRCKQGLVFEKIEKTPAVR